LLAAAVAVAGHPDFRPSAEELAPQLAVELEERGQDMRVSPARLVRCLETVTAAEAWPKAWLVIQDRSRDDDLLMHLQLSEDGRRLELGPAFVVERRPEWDHRAVKDAVRSVTGRPPREKVRNVVIQGFRETEETTYVYGEGEAVRDRGLASLLPADAILRDSRRIERLDGTFLTLGLAVVGPVFLPSDCACPDSPFGHADAGRVIAVLAGAEGLTDRVDLTPWLRGDGPEARLPRFACEPGDGADPDPASVRNWFRKRSALPLLRLEDLNGDGRALEVEIPAERDGCAVPGAVLAVDPSRPELSARSAGSP